MLIRITLFWLSILALAFGAGTIVYEPSMYFSERDSPFYGGIIDNTGEGIFLENFEDQALNTPYVRQEEDAGREGNTIRSLYPNTSDAASLGVDGDDGLIDGLARGGDVWTSVSTAGGGPSRFMSFEFEPNEYGKLPLFVGLVITRPNNFFAQTEVYWDDFEGNEIYNGVYFPRDWTPPGGANAESPLRQRFVGLYHEEGISRIFMSNVNQIDHLQYGYSIPEPSTGLLTIVTLTLLFSFRRRK